MQITYRRVWISDGKIDENRFASIHVAESNEIRNISVRFVIHTKFCSVLFCSVVPVKVGSE